jgi:metallo-beta-lactamase family protein
MESTYGNREREDEGDRTETLFGIIRGTTARGGKVIISSFAVGRTQGVLTRLNDLAEAGRLPGLRVYVDSPMAVAATKAFALHPEAYSGPVQELLESGDAPLQFPGLSLVTRVDDSIAINKSQEPAVIISASGMSTAAPPEAHYRRCQEHHHLRGLPGGRVTGPNYSIRRVAGANIRPVVSVERPGRDD